MMKPAGAICPACRALFCAEYAQLGQSARWTCHECGATGELAGDVARGKAPATPSAGKQAKPHWKTAAAHGGAPKG